MALETPCWNRTSVNGPSNKRRHEQEVLKMNYLKAQRKEATLKFLIYFAVKIAGMLR